MSHNEPDLLIGSKIRVELASPDYVDLWIAQYAPTSLQKHLDSLSHEERSRGGLFLQPADGERFLIRRAALRTILASYLSIAPGDVRFRYNEHGAPSLATEPNDSWQKPSNQHQLNNIRFSASSSGDCWCVAVASGCAVGVDIEFCREGFGTEEIAATFMSKIELERWNSLPSPERDQAFWRLWTAKEAILKGTGKGLSISPHLVELDLLAEMNHAQTNTRVSLASEQWSVYHWFIPADALLSTGAVADYLLSNSRPDQEGYPPVTGKSISLAIAVSK